MKQVYRKCRSISLLNVLYDYHLCDLINTFEFEMLFCGSNLNT